MSESEEYDLVVLGAGPVGENLASRAVRGGLTAVVVEAELVGGECSYWACMPSKAMLRPALALADAKRVDGAAQAVTGGLDAARVLARRTAFTHHWSDESQLAWLASEGIDLVRGHGRLAGERRVEVHRDGGPARVLTARHAVGLCTGSTPTLPPIEGLAGAEPWDSRDATSAASVPESLAVLGGGVVGVEMATAYQALGSRVTLLVRGRLLPKLEPFVGTAVAAALDEAGVDVRPETATTAVRRDERGVHITLGDSSTVTAAELLVATGRTPATAGIGLDTVGLDPDQKLTVDDSCRVNGLDWLYAVGDVNGRALLTHMGKYQARASADAIVARARGEKIGPSPWSRYAATADHDAVPQVVFTDPEVAAVGHSEATARAAGLPVRCAEYDTGQVAGASLYADGYTGRAKFVVDHERNVLVGATFVGAASGELLHAATIAVTGAVPLDRLWHAVPSYPTISEVWLRLLETYGL